VSEGVSILGLGTAVPEHVLETADAREFARGLFGGDFPALERLLEVFDNTRIDRRTLAMPTSWYGQPHDFPEKNKVYVETSLALSERAASEALARARVRPEDVGAIVFTSSTGVATPSLDGRIAQDLGLDASVARLPLWGLGCAGGGAGLGRAMHMAEALGKPVLLIAVEVCSVTFVYEDRRKANVVAVALFGDGAAAAVVGAGEQSGPALLSSFSHLIPDSEQVMGWDLCSTGLKVRFSPEIPGIVVDQGGEFVDEAAATVGATRSDVRHWVLHPGGAKVLDAYEHALGLSGESLGAAREVLRKFGNMSSPTVLFVLEEYLRASEATGDLGVLMGLGPGFCAEGVVFRW
jgi:alkylresorcinol/alkylpyrone synthase